MKHVPAGHEFRFDNGDLIARAIVDVPLSGGRMQLDDFESPLDLNNYSERLHLTAAVIDYCRKTV